MRKSKFTESQIVAILAEGVPVERFVTSDELVELKS